MVVGSGDEKLGIAVMVGGKTNRLGICREGAHARGKDEVGDEHDMVDGREMNIAVYLIPSLLP